MTKGENPGFSLLQSGISPHHVSLSNDVSNVLRPLNSQSCRDSPRQDQKYHQQEYTDQQDVFFLSITDTSTIENHGSGGNQTSMDRVAGFSSCASTSQPVTECQKIPTVPEQPIRIVDQDFSSIYASFLSNKEWEKEGAISLPTQIHFRQDSETENGMNNLESKKSEGCCGIGLRLIVVVNIILVVTVVATISILPLEAANRMSMSSALMNINDASTEPISRSVGSNLLFLEEIVRSVFNDLQLNRTAPLRPWTEVNMPEVMGHLCGILLTSKLRRHLLYLHVSSPFSAFGAYCSRQYDGGTLVGTYNMDNTSDYRYGVDRKTLMYAEPREPVFLVRRMSEAEYAIDFASPNNVFMNVVIPWYTKGRDNPWFIFAHNNEVMITFTYPFIDYRGNPGMVTGALQLSKLRTFNDKSSFPIHSDYVMVVELETGLVLDKKPSERRPTMWDNWNCTYEPSLCRNFTEVERLDSISDPHMAAAVEKLGGQHGIVLLMRNSDLVGVSFELDGVGYRAVVSRVYKNEERPAVVVITLTRESTLTETLYATHNKVFLTVLFSLFAIVFAELAIVYTIIKPLHVLYCGIVRMIQFRDGSKYFKSTSTFKELAWLQCKLRIFNRQLMYMKKLLPADVTERCDSDSIGSEGRELAMQEIMGNSRSLQKVVNSTSPITTTGIVDTDTKAPDSGADAMTMIIPSTTTTPTSTSTTATTTTTTTTTTTNTTATTTTTTTTTNTTLHGSDNQSNDNHSLRPDELDVFHARLNESVSKYEINQFRRRFCSVVCLTMVLRDDDNSIDGFVKTFSESSIPLIRRYSGVIEVQRPNFLLVSFGAHSQMAQHQTQAVRFALELLQQLSLDIAECVGVVVDSDEYLVGTCGTPDCNTRTTHGLHIPMQMDFSKLFLSLRCHIVVTRPVAIALDKQFLTIPVEAVYCRGLNTPLMLYELRGCTAALATTCVSDVMHHIAIIRRAFLHMLAGRYVEAARLLVQIEGKDVQGDRLLRVCRRLMRKGTTRPYIRTWGQLLTTTLQRKGSSSNTNNVVIFSPLPGDFRLPMLRAKHSFLHEGTELENTVLSGVSARSPGTRSGIPAPGSFSDAMRFEECPDKPLFEMLIDSSIDNDEDDEDDVQDAFPSLNRENERIISPKARSTAKGELPFVFTDHQGNSWVRSVDKLGTGTFSVVYRGMSSLGDLVALKCFALRSRHIEIEGIVEELKLFSQLRHGNIVQYISCYFSSDYLIEVMELVPGGSLDGILSSFGTLSAVTVRRFLRDALQGLMYLHSKNAVHCDVKPHNVLVAMDGVYKLSDFGSSLLRLTNSMHEISDVCEMRGTPGYMAPEVARGELPTGKSDIFSLGITVLELLTGRLPWDYAWKQGEGAQSTHPTALEENEKEEKEEKEEGQTHQQCNTAREEKDEEEEEETQRDIERCLTTDVDMEMPQSPTWFPAQDNVFWHNAAAKSQPTIDNSTKQTTRPEIDELLRNPAQLLISVGKGEVVPVIPQWLEDEVRDFVGLCVASDPEKRATLKELMQHPWMV
ncbi:Protein kinase domain [Trypanosoma melophagium]|uniref:Protein kinase domain n=1 Tax=Trypanosoma melophagium TaxID=715481 RepID=UPI00351A7339|nr:Protein kinase domain [Trypanosoma melophagium]